MGTMEHLTEYLGAAKTALDLFRGIRAEMPPGPLSDEAGQQIENAGKALKASEAELAKSLGYQLCRCSWPPEIMLWEKDRRASICPSCGDQHPPQATQTEEDDSWVQSRYF